MNLGDLTKKQLKEYIVSSGQSGFRAQQIFKWIHSGIENVNEMTNIPLSLREQLSHNFEIYLPRVYKKLESKIDGTVKYLLELSDGNIIDPAKPSASDILRLVFDPELTHKGSWLAWFGAVFLSILNAVSILYADELFHWDLSFQIRNAETAEPSDWELMKRYLGWTVFTIMVLVIYIVGLRA